MGGGRGRRGVQGVVPNSRARREPVPPRGPRTAPFSANMPLSGSKRDRQGAMENKVSLLDTEKLDTSSEEGGEGEGEEGKKKRKKAVLKHKTEDEKRNQMLQETSIAVLSINKSLKSDFIGHTLPALVALVVLLILSLGSFPTANVNIVIGVTVGILVMLFGGYLCIPIYDPKKKMNLYGWKKVKYVYGNPPIWPFLGMLLFIIAATVVIPYFVIGTGEGKLDWWHRMVGASSPSPVEGAATGSGADQGSMVDVREDGSGDDVNSLDSIGEP